MRSILSLVSLLVLTATASAQEPAPTPEAAPDEGRDELARQHFGLGAAAYDRGDFSTAIAEFEEAYRLSGRAELQHNLYLAYRDARRTDEAVRALRLFLETASNVQNREQLVARLRAMEAEVEERDRQAAAPPETSPEPQPQREEVEDEGSSLPLGPILVAGAGGLVLVGALITGIHASSLAGDLDDTCDNGRCPQRLRGTLDDARTFATITDILWITGAIAVGAGVAWFALDDDADERPSASLGCSPDGCVANVRGSF